MLDFDKSKMHVLSNLEVSRVKKKKTTKEMRKRHIKQIQKAENTRTYLNPTMSVILLNINRPNTPVT